jgi:acyl-homoserine lactone acylase PvdQ
VEATPHGVVIASDRAHDRVFALRWSGAEPGAAAELGALALDRAGTWTEFRAALAKWKMPARRVIYADVDGHVGFQDAALVPRRRSHEWTGWLAVTRVNRIAEGEYDVAGRLMDMEDLNRGMLRLYLSTQPLAA